MEIDHIATEKLQRLLIATDGLNHLNDKFLQGENIEGMTKISDFFNTESYFENVVSLPKFLTELSINKNILKDDTTMIMLRQ